MGLIVTFSLEDFVDDGGASVRAFLEAMETDIRNLSVVWVATRREDKKILKRDGSPYLDEDGRPLAVGIYHIQGVFTEERHAVAACRDPDYLIGELTLNLSLPHEAVEWVGAYFPLRRRPLLPPATAGVPFWRQLRANTV